MRPPSETEKDLIKRLTMEGPLRPVAKLAHHGLQRLRILAHRAADALAGPQTGGIANLADSNRWKLVFDDNYHYQGEIQGRGQLLARIPAVAPLFSVFQSSNNVLGNPITGSDFVRSERRPPEYRDVLLMLKAPHLARFYASLSAHRWHAMPTISVQ